MKYIDFIGQSLLLLTTLVLTFVFFGTGILVGQFLLGGWQMLSSSISLLTDAPLRRKKAIHFVCAAIYLTFFFTIGEIRIFQTSTMAAALLMLPAWIMALYYFSITWAWAFADTKRSKFLPNISF